MITLLTQEAVRYTRNKVVRCLYDSRFLIYNHLPDKFTHAHVYSVYTLWYHLEPSLWSFRGKMEHFFEKLMEIEEGDSKEYILYTARRSGNMVNIKALPRRIKSIRTLHSLDVLMPGDETHFSPEKKLATAIMDITFLRCLFSLGRKERGSNILDLSKAALPDDDVKARVGKYNLLYDQLDKEWSLWI